ncbi:M15 family metallopeptidase [Thalassotalea profundi]|uniref:M15 family metallopeptidase n=1 Tax=Thalassotalea profundi TaxID=2036687 RepID=UPI001E39627D|nr:M15 family metallopeptidase [Thalassotalea profundi]
MNKLLIRNAQVVGQDEYHLSWLSPKLAIHNDMLSAWKDLVSHAKQSGFELSIASGYRSFDRQLSIWNKKFNGELAVRDKHNNIIELDHLNETDKVMAILTYSALPGASRHHWGTDIDVYATNLLPNGKSLQLEPWEYQEQGYFFPLSQWLDQHANEFGFFFPYSQDRGGIAIEPWHMSFQPLAQQYENKLTLPLLANLIGTSKISGKKAILANLTSIFTQYITNICHTHLLDNNAINKEDHG